MKRAWLIGLGLAATAAFAMPAAAKIPSPGNPCPDAGSTYMVDTVGKAVLVSDGFDCKTVDLVITVSITPSTATLAFNAKTITVNGPLTIDNTFSSDSDIFLTGEGGGISISGATIRANDHLILECKPALCPINIQSSVIRSPINDLLTTGDTRAIAHGDVIIENSTFFGKNKVGVFSTAGKIVWHCGAGSAICEDPLTSGVSATLCPTGFPCTVTYQNPDALRAVCFPGPIDVDCGGGTGECQVNAFHDVDLEDSRITCNAHFSVTSKVGSINLKGAVITAKDPLSFQAFLVIDATNARLTSQTGSVTLEAKGGKGPGVPCIILKGAVISSPKQIKANGGCQIVP